MWSDGRACLSSSGVSILMVSISMVCDSEGPATVDVVDCISVGSASG